MKKAFMERRMAQIERRYEAGRKYARQEAAALAGMAEDPKVPDDCLDNSDFEDGYNDWLTEPDSAPISA